MRALTAPLAVLLLTTILAGPAAADVDAGLRDLCDRHPDRVRVLFAALDLDRPGLGTVRAAAGAGDWPAACAELLSYYRKGDTASWLRTRAVTSNIEAQSGGAADSLLSDIFTLYAETAKQPRRADGGLDWNDTGPTNDREWAWGLNRHMFLITLMNAWRATGNVRYIEHVDDLIADWVLANPVPKTADSSAPWRTLETSLRMGNVWPDIFYGLQGTEAFTPATRILMLSSVPEHGAYLRTFATQGGNWGTMQMYGLARIAVCWPEFRDAGEWRDHAAARMVELMRPQVYPDGAQTELTSHYHHVALNNFEKLLILFDRVGAPLPDFYRTTIEDMYDYLALTIRPDGFGLLNNDADRDDNRKTLITASDRYGRPDWRGIVEHDPASVPPGPPSRVFPWAGQLIDRDGWGSRTQWGFFDFGPWGTGHQHNDKLHLSVTAHGRDLLVDSGRFTYRPDRWRAYAVSTRAHNTVVIDGAGQRPHTPRADAPRTGTYAVTPDIDFAIGSFTDGYGGNDAKVGGSPVHTRAVVYLRGGYWVVIDRIMAAGAHTATTFWHFHPRCTVMFDGASVVTTDGGEGNIRVVPAGVNGSAVRLLNGVEEPEVMGWYSERYNVWEPNTVAAYDTPMRDSLVMAWVLLPSEGDVPMPSATILPAQDGAVRVSVAIPGRGTDEVAVRMDGDGPVTLSGGLTLDGRCAVLRDGREPAVVLGSLIDDSGTVIARHEFTP